MRLPFRRPAAAAWRARWVGTAIALVAAGGAVALGDVAAGTGGAVVVPNAYASVESWYGLGGPLNCAGAGLASQRYQQVFAGNEVGTGTITRLAFRPDASQDAFGPTTVPNVTIALSTTTQPVAGLAQNFGSNTGADVATVFSGDLVLSSAASGPSGGPKDFDVIVPLQHSFVFDGAAGNLLLDVTVPTCVRAGLFDAVDGTSSVSEVHTYYFDSTSDRADAGWPGRGLVTQFTFGGPAVLSDVTATTNEDTASTVTLGTSAPGAGGLSYIVTSLPAHGTLADGTTTISSVPAMLSGNSVTYTPTANYNNADTAPAGTPDSFGFKTNDGVQDSNAAVASITVLSLADTTSTAYTGQPQAFVDKNSKLVIGGAITSKDPGCVGTQSVQFSLDRAPVAAGTTPYSLGAYPTNGAGSVSRQLSIAGWQPGSYVLNAQFEGFDSFAASPGAYPRTQCTGSQGSATLKIQTKKK